MDSIICMVCLWGIACAIVTTSVNIKLITGIMSNKSKKNDEMRLFYCRFIIDICFGISLFTSVLITLLSIRAPDLIQDYRSIIIFHSLPWSNLAACRSTIALSITADRVLAAYFPIAYRTGKFMIPAWLIITSSIAFALSEVIVLFGCCSYDFVVPVNCKVFGCAVNKCFYSFWTIHKSVIGPYIAVAKITGCAIEAIIVAVFLIAKKPKQLKSITVNGRKVTVVNHSTKQTTSTFHK
ncbi:Protein CBG06472 [Caenorhabditis briggsae]|uniref:Protein CBG06472 n=1 Tax=Caenorhabditis briggsae TaxID=6238 RepID=A8X2A9_CAEBR|nr:Protein CBG06472 [Caenorhabditis briggsae]CAP26769.2 Protein CBG06472 [Caenorhabditis briggsae]